jgi:FMN-dependent NADH-azoreductase
MKILHVTCSPRGQASESRRLSLEIIGHLLRRSPSATVVDRVVGDGSVPPIDGDYALSQQSSADQTGNGTAAVSDELIDELESADLVVIGTPMHNFTVPAALKVWIDHVVRARRTFNVTPLGKAGMLRDRPVFVAVSSGGKFSGEHARQPDYLTSYLRAILGITGLHDLTFFSVEGVAFGPEALAHARAKAGQALQEFFFSSSREDRQ